LVVLGHTLKVVDDVGKDLGFTNKPARPFDIQEYTAALIRLNDVITNFQQLSLTADQLTRSEGWRNGLRDVSDITDRRVDRAFSRICMALGLAFLLAVVYRIISLQLSRRMALSAREKQ